MNPLPPGRYDAIFSCYEIAAEQRCFANATFFNDSGRMYIDDTARTYHVPRTIQVTLNGHSIKGFDERVPVGWPEPLSWRITGNDRYPSVTRTIQSDSAIEFFSPSADTLNAFDSIVVRYHAPKSIDSVLFHYSYFGDCVYKRDTTKTEHSGQSYYYKVRNESNLQNGGRYVIPPLKVFDYIKSFKPEKLMIQIMWARGDSVHVGDYVYGFEASGHNTRFYRLKP
ncbi:MAG: hypothetical protein Q8922_01655 [Bacteroidota bacterium]|nr:hypothetical protein [Bacteroidota bacterium]MDP4232067.1 hypothetical protein [Bacteroidota bacterium]MDP4241226.1 hypothetical protein [Bacteroidota bacterium]MDP4286618.1 hypothetical protein [Bacteroidota bacterium]